MNYAARRHAYRTGWREALTDLARNRVGAENKAQRYLLTTGHGADNRPDTFEDHRRLGYIDGISIITLVADFTGDCGEILCPFRRLAGAKNQQKQACRKEVA